MHASFEAVMQYQLCDINLLCVHSRFYTFMKPFHCIQHIGISYFSSPLAAPCAASHCYTINHAVKRNQFVKRKIFIESVSG